ncbi:hypothetical protein B0T21DRAFT_415255 [Apiosordaria backusii]|uniref:WW domain-containing protein n=1 Tax=Apiosordaria backusii TaxID=314023 RepID=A0AA40AIM4_9PEZI|nr:hypothetical protein B0T21DRAFT_415255 [Apiosordaria backusii]
MALHKPQSITVDDSHLPESSDTLAMLIENAPKFVDVTPTDKKKRMGSSFSPTRFYHKIANLQKPTTDPLVHPDQIKSPRESPHRHAQPAKSSLKSPTPAKPPRVRFASPKATCIITSKAYTPTNRNYWEWCRALHDAGVIFKNHRPVSSPEPKNRECDEEEQELDIRLAKAKYTADEQRNKSPQYQDKERYAKMLEWKEKRKEIQREQKKLVEAENMLLGAWAKRWDPREVTAELEKREKKKPAVVNNPPKESKITRTKLDTTDLPAPSGMFTSLGAYLDKKLAMSKETPQAPSDGILKLPIKNQADAPKLSAGWVRAVDMFGRVYYKNTRGSERRYTIPEDPEKVP